MSHRACNASCRSRTRGEIQQLQLVHQSLFFSKPRCDIVILFNDTDEDRNAKVMVFHYFHGVFQFPARFRLSLYDEVENEHKLSLGL